MADAGRISAAVKRMRGMSPTEIVLLIALLGGGGGMALFPWETKAGHDADIRRLEEDLPNKLIDAMRNAGAIK